MAVDLFKLQGSVEVNTGKAEADLKRVDLAARKTQTALSQTDQAGKKAGQGITTGFNSSVASGSRLSGLISSLQSKLSSLKAPSLNFGGGSGGGIGASVSMLTKSNLLTGAITSAMSGMTDALKQGYNAGIAYNEMLENATVRMTRFFSTAKETDSFVASIEKFAAVSPVYDMETATKGAQRLLMMKFAAKDVIPALTAIGDAIAGVGGNAESIDAVMMQMSQMIGKGKLLSEDLQIIAEHGVPVWELLAKAAGVSEKAMRDAVGKGLVDSKRAVQGIIAMMGQDFGGQAEKASQTLSGRRMQAESAVEMQLAKGTRGSFNQQKELFGAISQGFSTQSSDQFAVKMDQMLTKLGADLMPMVQKLASGEYFMQGLNAINFGEQASAAFDKGDFKGGANLTGQAIGSAIGMKRGAAGEDQTANAIADSLKQKPIFSSEFDAKLVQWITGALMKAEVAAKEGGKLVGLGAGENVIKGTKDSLDAHSPSRKMMALGHDAMEGFGIGFNNAIDGEIDRNSAGIKKWAKAIAEAGGEEFLKEVERIAANLKIDPNKLMNVMAFESGLDPSKKNPNSSATGLIQFMNSTATQLGTTTADLKGMNAIEQLKYVEAYFKQFKSLVDTQEAIYTAVLAGRPVSDPESVLFSKGGKSTGRAYSANAALDKDASGTITAREAAAQAYKQGFLSVETSAAKTSGILDQFSSAIESAKSQITSMAASIAQYMGLSSATPSTAAPVVRAVPQQKPAAQTINAGAIESVETRAKAEKLALSSDAQSAASSIGQMRVATKEVAVTSGATSETLKSTTSRVGEFADMIGQAGSAASKAIDHFAEFKDAFASGIDDIFDGNFSAKDFGKSLLKNLSGGLISQATGGAASSPGQFLSKMLFGGLSGGGVGGGGMGSVPATGGFAGGGGAADILKGAAGQMNFGKLPGMSKVGGFLSKIPFFGKLFGGGASAATGAAGAGAAAGGGGFMSGLLGAAGGPVGLIAGLAMPLVGKLFGLFGGNPLKDYKKLVKGEYGISISDQVASKIMQTGQSKFGNEWQKRKIETVRLPEIRDMLSEYSGAFMKGGNDKLFDSRMFSDQFSAVNQIKVPMRANGGRVRGGKPYLVGERQAEIFVPYSDGQVMPNAGRGGMFGKGIEEVLARVAQALDRFESMPAEQVVVTGIARRPGIAAADVRQDFERRGEHSQRMREILAAR